MKNTELLEKVRREGVGVLGLKGIQRNNLIAAINREPRRIDPEGEFLTMGHVMDLFGNHRHSGLSQDLDKKIFQFFLDKGLTYLEWNRLPVSTVTKKLNKLTKEEILELPVECLGSLSGTARFDLFHNLSKRRNGESIKVSELILHVKYSDMHSRSIHLKTSFVNTYRLLRSLGFGYDDGIFFQYGTRRTTAEKMLRKYRVTPGTADRIAEIAELEGWERYPVDKIEQSLNL